MMLSRKSAESGFCGTNISSANLYPLPQIELQAESPVYPSISRPAYNECDLSPYRSFFIAYAREHFDEYRLGETIFDPNISDQLCHLRAVWLLEQFRHYPTAASMPEEILELLGIGMILVQAIPYTVNGFGMMDNWYDLHRTEFEALLNAPFSTKRRSQFVSFLKSYLSRKVNDHLRETHLGDPSLHFRDDLLFHFSNPVHFSQKSVKIPYVPFFMSGYAFLEFIRRSGVQVALLYRHFVADGDETLYLNGIECIQLRENVARAGVPLHLLTQNVIVVETYSCYFAAEENHHGLSFHRSRNFSNVLHGLEQSFDFYNFLLSAMAAHDGFHQPLSVMMDGSKVDYDDRFVSREYQHRVQSFRHNARELGIGLRQWNPSKGFYLEGDVPLNFFHIYPSTHEALARQLQTQQETHVGRRYPLGRNVSDRNSTDILF